MVGSHCKLLQVAEGYNKSKPEVVYKGASSSHVETRIKVHSTDLNPLRKRLPITHDCQLPPNSMERDG